MITKIQKHLDTIQPYLSLKDIGRTYALLTPFMSQHWRAYLGLFLFLFVDTFLTLAFSWFFGNITDAAIQSDFYRMKWLIPIGALVVILSMISTYSSTYFETIANNAVKKDFSAHLYKHMLLLPGKNIANNHSGELMSHFTNDIHSIDGMIGGSLINLIRLPLIYTAVFIYLTQISWELSILGIMIAPIALCSAIIFGLLLRKNSRLIHSQIGKINSLLSETFHGFFVIRSFILEKKFFTKYVNQNQALYTLELNNSKLRGWFYVGGQAVSSITFLVSLCWGSYYVSSDVLTIGALLTFVNLVNHLVYPLTALAEQWAGFQRSATAMERIFKILDQPVESIDLPSTIHSKTFAKSINIQDVYFSYNGQTNIFEQLNLQIPAGKVVAIVGQSGAGKTTLFNLLLGIHKPQSGSILIDDRPTDEMSASDLRAYFAHVPQETFLFGGTVRENLLMAREEITDAEMIEAATIANIHSFIASLPQGYDTEIGERGVKLSGGQKQRLAIARAILKDAPILLMDEATSALDNETELLVKEALNRVMKNRTTLIIAHRLSTIRNADLIIYMDKGKIVRQYQKGASIVDYIFDTSFV